MKLDVLILLLGSLAVCTVCATTSSQYVLLKATASGSHVVSSIEPQLQTLAVPHDLDFSLASSVNSSLIYDAARGGLSQVLLYGYPASGKFKVTKAYLSLPSNSNSVSSSDSGSAAAIHYYALSQGTDDSAPCFVAPCTSNFATRVDTQEHEGFSTLDTGAAMDRLVQSSWLNDRLYNSHTAIVAGSIANAYPNGGGFEMVLTAQNVFIQVPDKDGACSHPLLAKCQTGRAAFTRTVDMCLKSDGCSSSGGMCAMMVPACSEGYNLASFSAKPYGCNQYLCDAWFLN